MAEKMEIKIDQENLSEELATHSARFVYVAEQAIREQLAADEFKMKVEELYAVVDLDVRLAAEKDGKKITEKAIENAVKINESYKKAYGHFLKLRAQAEIMRAHRDAWRERGAMLVQMSTNKRSELEALTFDTVREKAAA